MTQVARPAGATGTPPATRNYRLLLGAFFVSTAGDWLYRLALPLLALQLTGSVLHTAAVYAVEYLPYLMAAPVAGVLADRADRRRLLIRADLASTAAVGLLAVLVWTGTHQLWMVYATAFAVSAIAPLHHAALQGLVPRTVPAHRLGWANSRLQAAQSTLDLAGPLGGGAAVAALGTAWALTADAATFAASALILGMLARSVGTPATGVPAGGAPATIRKDLRDAMGFLRATPALYWGALLATGSTFGLTAVSSNMIAYLVSVRGEPVGSIGVAFAALGAGALAGAMVAPRTLRSGRPGLVIIGCMAGSGAATALLAIMPNVWTIAATWSAVGALTMIFTVSFHTLRHRLVPSGLLGRVVALTRLLAFAPLPVAPLAGGVLLGATGRFWPVAIMSAAVQVAAGIAAWFSPLRAAAIPRQDREPGQA